jgi:hypothetical protein
MAKRHFPDWLAGYLEYNSNQEATDKLHFWVGATILSAALKRQVYMKRIRYNLYPNLYVLIVADSGVARKSVAMDIGVNLIKDAVPDIFYVSGSLTPEGLVKHMNREKMIIKSTEDGKKVEVQYDSHLLLHADELGEAFGYDRTRASKFVMLLTKIYGAQREHTHTIASQDQIRLRNLYPVFLGGSDPTNLKVLPEEAVGGLLGRIIFVTETARKRNIAWENEAEAAKAAKLYTMLKEDLHTISCLSGEVVPTEDARILFEEWYERISNMEIPDRRLSAFRERCHDTALKLAIILKLSESDDLIVDIEHVSQAIQHIERQLPEFSRVADWAATSVYAQNRARFIELLRRQAGAATRAQALKHLNLPLDEILVLETSLEQERTIEVRLAGKDVLYRLTKGALDRA